MKLITIFGDNNATLPNRKLSRFKKNNFFNTAADDEISILACVESRNLRRRGIETDLQGVHY